MAAIKAETRLDPVAASARDAREFVSGMLQKWEHGDLGEVACLLVSELVTNAVLHARSPIELQVRLAQGILRIEVRDTNPVLPVRLDLDDTALTGRGLTLVEACAQRWGAQPTDEGKSVWFELAAEAAG